MEKAAVATNAKPGSQRSATETFQKTEEQTNDVDLELAFDLQNKWFHDGGRAIDLSRIPASANILISLQEEPGKINPQQQEDLLTNKISQDDRRNETTSLNDQGEFSITEVRSTSVMIAEDSARSLAEGQMRKTEFLQKLRTEICRTIEPTLDKVGQTTEGCPYLNYWLDLYHEKNAAHIERTAKKYAPGTVDAKTAEEYISIIAQRALKAAEIWVKTGKITDIPDEVHITLPGLIINKNIQFKARKGGIKNADDPRSIQEKLGEGRPLESAIRSRMESAFLVNLSDVRTHTDSTAATISDHVNARAFTIGDHIAFANGEYQPNTLVGDALLAHELAHTIQQDGAENSVDKLETATSDYNALENDADQTAVTVIHSLWGKEKNTTTGVSQKAFTGLRTGLRLQRCSGKTKAATTIRAIPQAPSSDLLEKMGLSRAPSSNQPLKLPFGGYLEFIGWETDGRNGMIVQEINNTLNLTSCSGSSLRGEVKPDPRYWEIWSVDGDGKVSPNFEQVNDAWVRASHRDTSGNFSINAKVFWVEALDIQAGFRSYNPNVPTVPNLKTTANQPGNLDKSLLDRHAAGSWDCTGNHV